MRAIKVVPVDYLLEALGTWVLTTRSFVNSMHFKVNKGQRVCTNPFRWSSKIQGSREKEKLFPSYTCMRYSLAYAYHESRSSLHRLLWSLQAPQINLGAPPDSYPLTQHDRSNLSRRLGPDVVLNDICCPSWSRIAVEIVVDCHTYLPTY